ncbi:MAG: DUF4956 domain-containing protein [Bacteroidales bacterium]|nr:DUF4956 domain-containing protein [Bacteroidales bacterium]MCM1414703.1 DUF4956 domain-containing protein [bacterium]MCM1422512.1 DUF4956 domain-containing protein [bacterium]
MENTIKSIMDSYYNSALYTSVIVSVLLVALLLGVYEFIVYRLVSHRAFYNRSFNICITILPLFIATIVLCLQSNIVITLGTIGALAILRFRTTVKDPVDMLYLLWSVHIGITCGCQLYEVAILTALAATILLIVLEHISIGRKPFVLVLHCAPENEGTLLETIGEYTRKYRIKSRNFTARGMDLVMELSVKDPQKLSESIRETNAAEKFSIIEYDSDDVL